MYVYLYSVVMDMQSDNKYGSCGEESVFKKRNKYKSKKPSHPVSTNLSWLLFGVKDISVQNTAALL